MFANVSSNNNNTIGQDGTNMSEAATAAVHARAQRELAKAAEEAQKVLQGLDRDEAQNERLKIHLFDYSENGAYTCKGSGDKVRKRNIYQELYEKTAEAGWKITDIMPARAIPVGHTNKVVGFWHAFVEAKALGEKIDVRSVMGSMHALGCKDIVVAPVCYPEMPGACCIVITEDNIGVGAKINEMQKAGCTNINVIENKTYMFDEHRRQDPETRLGWRYIIFDAPDLTTPVGADGAAIFISDGDEISTAVDGTPCPVIDWCVPAPHGTITICGIHSPEALEPGAPEAETLAKMIGCTVNELTFSNAGAVQMAESRRVTYPRRAWAHGGESQSRRISAYCQLSEAGRPQLAGSSRLFVARSDQRLKALARTFVAGAAAEQDQRAVQALSREYKQQTVEEVAAVRGLVEKVTLQEAGHRQALAARAQEHGKELEALREKLQGDLRAQQEATAAEAQALEARLQAAVEISQAALEAEAAARRVEVTGLREDLQITLEDGQAQAVADRAAACRVAESQSRAVLGLALAMPAVEETIMTALGEKYRSFRLASY